MLITTRAFQELERQRKGAPVADFAWTVSPRDAELATKMLLVHQTGSLHIGEVAR